MVYAAIFQEIYFNLYILDTNLIPPPPSISPQNRERSNIVWPQMILDSYKRLCWGPEKVSSWSASSQFAYTPIHFPTSISLTAGVIEARLLIYYIKG